MESPNNLLHQYSISEHAPKTVGIFLKNNIFRDYKFYGLPQTASQMNHMIFLEIVQKKNEQELTVALNEWTARAKGRPFDVFNPIFTDLSSAVLPLRSDKEIKEFNKIVNDIDINPEHKKFVKCYKEIGHKRIFNDQEEQAKKVNDSITVIDILWPELRKFERPRITHNSTTFLTPEQIALKNSYLQDINGSGDRPIDRILSEIKTVVPGAAPAVYGGEPNTFEYFANTEAQTHLGIDINQSVDAWLIALRHYANTTNLNRLIDYAREKGRTNQPTNFYCSDDKHVPIGEIETGEGSLGEVYSPVLVDLHRAYPEYVSYDNAINKRRLEVLAQISYKVFRFSEGSFRSNNYIPIYLQGHLFIPSLFLTMIYPTEKSSITPDSIQKSYEFMLHYMYLIQYTIDSFSITHYAFPILLNKLLPTEIINQLINCELISMPLFQIITVSNSLLITGIDISIYKRLIESLIFRGPLMILYILSAYFIVNYKIIGTIINIDTCLTKSNNNPLALNNIPKIKSMNELAIILDLSYILYEKMPITELLKKSEPSVGFIDITKCKDIDEEHIERTTDPDILRRERENSAMALNRTINGIEKIFERLGQHKRSDKELEANRLTEAQRVQESMYDRWLAKDLSRNTTVVIPREPKNLENILGRKPLRVQVPIQYKKKGGARATRKNKKKITRRNRGHKHNYRKYTRCSTR
jgi:hypothetical protein